MKNFDRGKKSVEVTVNMNSFFFRRGLHIVRPHASSPLPTVFQVDDVKERDYIHFHPTGEAKERGPHSQPSKVWPPMHQFNVEK
jgi:hypothetical protein